MPTAATVSDEALIPGLIARDEAALAALLDRYWTRAYRVALQLTGDPAAAEDAAQETFVRLLDKAGQFEAGRAFRPWFFKILVNAAKQQRRAATRRKAYEARPEAQARPAPTPPAAALEAAETQALVRSHLAGLSPKLRSALALRYLEDLSLGEVAEALGIPPGTVSSRIRRGLESLRESLQPTLSLSGVAGVEWLRRAMEAAPAGPTAPGPAEVLAALLDRPLGPPIETPHAPEPASRVQCGPSRVRPIHAATV